MCGMRRVLESEKEPSCLDGQRTRRRSDRSILTAGRTHSRLHWIYRQLNEPGAYIWDGQRRRGSRQSIRGYTALAPLILRGNLRQAWASNSKNRTPAFAVSSHGHHWSPLALNRQDIVAFSTRNTQAGYDCILLVAKIVCLQMQNKQNSPSCTRFSERAYLHA